jgi:cytochrome c peroxidase
MPITPAIYSPWQFWDGRADSLWSQALGPIENPVEHGFTRSELASAIRARYARRYTAVFGPLRHFGGDRASPLGDSAARRRWAAMPREQREAVDHVFVNAGKAIAAFERRQAVPETRFDLYVRWLGSGSRTASPLSSEEVEGLRIFAGTGRCTSCHSGPLLTNNEFANTGVPARSGTPPDRGRIEGVRKALADPFNCRGRFSDDRTTTCAELDFAVSGNAEQIRAYKVPSLRGVALRPPYMHAGQFATLESVIRHYSAAPKAPAGQSQLRPLKLEPAERRSLIAFLKTLNPSRATGDRSR